MPGFCFGFAGVLHAFHANICLPGERRGTAVALLHIAMEGAGQRTALTAQA